MDAEAVLIKAWESTIEDVVKSSGKKHAHSYYSNSLKSDYGNKEGEVNVRNATLKTAELKNMQAKLIYYF